MTGEIVAGEMVIGFVMAIKERKIGVLLSYLRLTKNHHNYIGLLFLYGFFADLVNNAINFMLVL